MSFSPLAPTVTHSRTGPARVSLGAPSPRRKLVVTLRRDCLPSGWTEGMKLEAALGAGSDAGKLRLAPTGDLVFRLSKARNSEAYFMVILPAPPGAPPLKFTRDVDHVGAGADIIITLPWASQAPAPPPPAPRHIVDEVVAPRARPVTPASAPARQPAPAPAPAPAREPDDAAIAAHIAQNGVTRAVDWGVHAALVASLKDDHCDVARTKFAAMPWRINGRPYSAAKAYAHANKLRAERGSTPLRQPKEG